MSKHVPKKILIVEDEKPLAEALELRLHQEGYVTKLAMNGKEAISFVEKENFDLVILDLVLPEMDGFAVLEEMKKRHISQKVLVATNLGQEAFLERMRSLGIAESLIKSDNSLHEIVNAAKKLMAE